MSGKVYNDKGHNICGVLNQHNKPCKRIGKCPFHGAHKAVTPHNSVNGTVDSTGTVATPSTSPDGTHTPPGPSSIAYENGSPGGSSSNTLTLSKPKVPPKRQYKHGWSKDEHFLFLGGLEQHGRGSWKQIASVVKTRTPTQVQSHAQKYFQRQKQCDKNKRSIHDLSLEHPEMQEIAKKFKTAHPRPPIPNLSLGDNLPTVGDHASFKAQGMHISSPSLGLNHHAALINSGAVIGRTLPNDSPYARFNAVSAPLIPKFGHAQATSATTLGSSLSSAVQIQHLPGTAPSRTFQGGSPIMAQPDLFVPLPQGVVASSQARPSDIPRNSLKMDGTSGRDIYHSRNSAKLDGVAGRDVLISSVRPSFMQESYHNIPNSQFLSSQSVFPNKVNPYTGHTRSMEPTPMPEATDGTGNMQMEQGSAQQPYVVNGLQGLYPAVNGNASVFPRAQNDSPLVWGGYEPEIKPKRQRDPTASTKDAFQLNNSQLNNSLQNIGAIPLPESLTGAPGIANVQPVEASFETNQQNQNNSFVGSIFGGVEVADCANVYGVGINPSTNPGNLNGREIHTSVSSFQGSTGLMGNLPARGQGSFPNHAFNRNG